MIIRPDGHNVFPAAIEQVILGHEAVADCTVVGKVDNENSSGKWPVAFCVLKPEWSGNPVVLSEIEKLCEKKIPPRDTATEFYVIDKLPLTEIGKVDYLTLERMAAGMV